MTINGQERDRFLFAPKLTSLLPRMHFLLLHIVYFLCFCPKLLFFSFLPSGRLQQEEIDLLDSGRFRIKNHFHATLFELIQALLEIELN